MVNDSGFSMSWTMAAERPWHAKRYSRSPASLLWISLEATAKLRGYPKQIVPTTAPSSLVDGSITWPDYLALRKGRRTPIHQARQTVPERICRKLQRSFPRRMPQPALVRHLADAQCMIEQWRQDYNTVYLTALFPISRRRSSLESPNRLDAQTRS